MKINLKLYATLRKYLPNTEIGEAVIIEVKQGSTIKDIIDKFTIKEELAKIIFVNGIHETLDYILQENDLLVIFPPIGGG
ncbi:MAG: MoaD/ThiS family protein [Candidatus Heimdallarchaeota archaeon]|nr:MoaD/ThiS family protein [Candidatus Heimdallarchaeota archaeon]MCK4254639.1 MoaD/ThiS family protein [Candidatus Heimdallarchaeota archaeon]